MHETPFDDLDALPATDLWLDIEARAERTEVVPIDLVTAGRERRWPALTAVAAALVLLVGGLTAVDRLAGEPAPTGTEVDRAEAVERETALAPIEDADLGLIVFDLQDHGYTSVDYEARRGQLDAEGRSDSFSDLVRVSTITHDDDIGPLPSGDRWTEQSSFVSQRGHEYWADIVLGDEDRRRVMFIVGPGTPWTPDDALANSVATGRDMAGEVSADRLMWDGRELISSNPTAPLWSVAGGVVQWQPEPDAGSEGPITVYSWATAPFDAGHAIEFGADEIGSVNANGGNPAEVPQLLWSRSGETYRLFVLMSSDSLAGPLAMMEGADLDTLVHASDTARIVPQRDWSRHHPGGGPHDRFGQSEVEGAPEPVLMVPTYLRNGVAVSDTSIHRGLGLRCLRLG